MYTVKLKERGRGCCTYIKSQIDQELRTVKAWASARASQGWLLIKSRLPGVRLFVFPTTFIGKDRYLGQHKINMINGSGKVCHPGMILTMICNLNWKIVKKNLLFEGTALEMPNICSRAFQIKLPSLPHAIKDNELFGITVKHARVFRIQKRGVSHANRVLVFDS